MRGEVRGEPIVGPVDSSVVPRFCGPTTFARLPSLQEVARADVGVIGVPFDAGVSYRPGARFGPRHVRQSSQLLRPYNPVQLVSPFAEQQVVDAGDIPCNPFDIDTAVREIELGVRAALDSVDRLVTIGGDHTIALPILRVMREIYGEVAVVHFDAHLDTWDTYFGAPTTHGTPFRRASEEGLIDRTASMHVGTRGPLYSAQDLVDDQILGFQVIGSHDLDDLGWRGVVEQIRRRVAGKPVYVSVDIDVLDPAFAPGTGTPEAGGMTSRELLAIIRSFADMNLIGGDVVEVSPAYDHAEVTGVAAAHVAYELISAMSPRGGNDGAGEAGR